MAEQHNPFQGDPSDSQFYNAPQNPQSCSSPCDYYPSNPNPTPSDPHPQHESSGANTGLPQPGVDLCSPVPYPPAAVTHGLPQQLMQPEAGAHFHDPSAQQQSWVADPVGCPATIVPSNEMEQIVGVNPDSMVWNNQMIPSYMSAISLNKNLKKTRVVQSAWCELCKVDCNSQEMFNAHKLGKKHMKLLKKLDNSKNVAATEPVATTVTDEPTIKPEENLETKRRKLVEGGTAVDSLRVCTLCNVVCNSETVFNMHLVGQKHAAKVASASDGMQPMVCPNSDPMICTDQASQPTVNDTTIKMNKKNTAAQRVWCELCIADCSTQEVLDNHKLGKRHKRNLEKLEELRNAAPAVKPENPDAGTNGSQPVEEAKTTGGKAKRKKAASTEEELGLKKRKLLECGSTSDSVKMCTICNIVCNSETVFNFHLAGKKHATQMKKQAPEITKSAFGPKPDSDATVTTVEPQPASVATATSTVNPRPATAATATPTDCSLQASVATAAPTVGTQLATAATSAPTATG